MNARRLLALAIAAPLTIPSIFITLSLLGELFGAPWYDHRALVFELALASAPHCAAASAAMAAPVVLLASWRSSYARRAARRLRRLSLARPAQLVALLLILGAISAALSIKPIVEEKFRAAKQEVRSCQGMHLD